MRCIERTSYQENAFRILGVSANATLKTVRDAYNTLKQRGKLGGLGLVDDPLCFLSNIERSEPNVRDAFNKLQNPQTRLKERLFWFTNSTYADEDALVRLASKDPKKAIQIWESDQNYTSIANLARLRHAICIFKDPDVQDTHLWMKALGSWRIIIESDDFWKHFTDIELDSGFEPSAIVSDIEILREDSWELVLKPSIVLAQNAINEAKYDVVRRHLDLIRGSGFPSLIVHHIEGNILEPLESRFEETKAKILKTLSDLLEDKEASLETKRKAGDQAYNFYKVDLFTQVHRLTQVAGVESEAATRAHQAAADCLRSISIFYHNHAQAYQISEQLLKEAQSLAPDSIISERIKEDLEIVSKSAQQENIWKDPKPMTSFDKWLIWVMLLLIFLIFPLISPLFFNSQSSYSNKPGLYSSPTHTVPYSTQKRSPQNNPDDNPFIDYEQNKKKKNPFLEYEKSIESEKRIETAKVEQLKTEIEDAKLRLGNQELELRELADKIGSYLTQIEQYATRIKQIESDIDSGYSINQDEYETALARHNFYVDLYNTELAQHNLKYAEYERLFKETNAKISEHNKMITGR